MSVLRTTLGVLFVLWVVSILSIIAYEISTRDPEYIAVKTNPNLPFSKPKVGSIPIAKEIKREDSIEKNENKNNAIQIPNVIPHSELKDDITFVFAIFDIGRKEHMGKSGKDYSFVDDYVHNLNKIISEMQPHTYVKVFIEKKYAEYVKFKDEYAHLMNDYLSITHYEIEDLRNFKYYDRIEKIRQDPSWIQNTGWLAGAPQGYSDLYNPIVMQKIFFLKRAADENIFKTKKFVWLDSGGICVPTLPLYGIKYHKTKFDFWLREDRFLITRSPYPNAGEIHGCHQALLVKFTNGYQPQHVCKGWVMGGTPTAIDNLLAVYDRLLDETLDVGCLGTEETLFTLAYESHPELFNIFSNSEPHNEWADNCCKFFVEPKEDELDRERVANWRL